MNGHDLSNIEAFDPKRAAEIALGEASKKITDIKKRQWDATNYCVLILGGLFFGLEGLPRLPRQITGSVAGAIVFVYYLSILWQTAQNIKRFKSIYRTVLQRMFPRELLALYMNPKSTPNNIDWSVEDEGRVPWLFLLIVCFAFALLIMKLYLSK